MKSSEDFLFLSLAAETSTTASTTLPPVNVMSAKEFEEQCRQPVAIINAVSMLVMMPVHIIGMFVLFTTFGKMYSPRHIAANVRRANNARNRIVPRQRV